MKNPLVIFVICLILALGGGYYFYDSYVAPEQQLVLTETARNNDLKKQLAEAKSAKEKSEKIEKELVELQGELERYKAFLPVEEQMGKLIQNLNRVAQETNLRITKLEPQAGLGDRGFYQEETIKMSVTGGYHDIASYFDKIGLFSRSIPIRHVSLRRSSEGGGLGGHKLNADFDAMSYLQKPLNIAPAAAKK
jgi:type IV pilus assembly protein PilO